MAMSALLPILPPSNTTGNGSCPHPFLDDRHFPHNGGYTAGRFCATTGPASNITCCLPCPLQTWEYDDTFIHSLDSASYIGLISFIGCLFLLISWIILPPVTSGRHYLSVGLVAAGALLSFAFVVPLSTPTQDTCYNEITPGDMNTSISCAVTGTLVQAGGLSIAIWVLLRSVWLHMRVVWDRIPGKFYLVLSYSTAIMVPAALLAVTIAISGFSYRVGKVCLLKHDGNSFALFWGWLIVCCVVAVVLQIATTIYCIYIYMRCHHERSKSAGSDLSRESRNSTVSRLKAFKNRYTRSFSRATNDEPLTPASTSTVTRWRNLSLVFSSQWRNLLLTSLFAIESIYFSTIFWSEDLKIVDASTHPKVQEFVECLVRTNGNREECLEDAEYLMLQKENLFAGFVLASILGLQCFLLLLRKPLILAWCDALRHPTDFWRNRRNDSSEAYVPRRHRNSAPNELPLTSPTKSYRSRLSTLLARDDEADAPNGTSVQFPASSKPPRPQHPGSEKSVLRKPISIIGARRMSSQNQLVEAAAGNAWTTQALYAPQPPAKDDKSGPSGSSADVMSAYNQRELPLPSTPAASRGESRPQTPQTLRGAGHNGLMMNPVMAFAERPGSTVSDISSSPSKAQSEMTDPFDDSHVTVSPEKHASYIPGQQDRLDVTPSKAPRRVSRFVEDVSGFGGATESKAAEPEFVQECEQKADAHATTEYAVAEEGLDSPVDPDVQGRNNSVDGRIGMAM